MVDRSRFSEAVDETAVREVHAVVVGCGNIGSFATLQLARMGVRQFTLIDHDIVDRSNVATQAGETDGYDAADHLAVIERHLDVGSDQRVADVVLANSNLPAEPLPEEWQSQPVSAPGDADYRGARLALADIVDPERRYRHDAERLASAVMRLYYERDLRVTAEAAVTS